jgi:hypothetical protein
MSDSSNRLADAVARMDLDALKRVAEDLRAEAARAGAVEPAQALTELVQLMEGKRTSAPTADALLNQQPALADLAVPSQVHRAMQQGDLHGASMLLTPWLERQTLPGMQFIGAMTQAVILARAGQVADAWKSADWARRIAVAQKDPNLYHVSVDGLVSLAASQGRDGVVLALFERAANALDALLGPPAGDVYRHKSRLMQAEWDRMRVERANREQWDLHLRSPD